MLGYMQITDRAKDVIKSGGEWISSIDLENAAVSHPAFVEALPHTATGKLQKMKLREQFRDFSFQS
ncbi:hypothetical protein EMIT0P253_260072 [Pseudomonas sp. IT-P253]|jgi:fatty-acyl-CoA synthase